MSQVRSLSEAQNFFLNIVKKVREKFSNPNYLFYICNNKIINTVFEILVRVNKGGIRIRKLA